MDELYKMNIPNVGDRWAYYCSKHCFYVLAHRLNIHPTVLTVLGNRVFAINSSYDFM